MGLAGLLSAGRVSRSLVGRTIIVGESSDLIDAENLIIELEERLGPVALGVVGNEPYGGARPHTELPREYGAGRKRLRRLRPDRVIVIGEADARTELIAGVSQPVYWVNAVSPEVAGLGCEVITVGSERQRARIPAASLTGDPLLGLRSLPGVEFDPTVCERFKEYRDRGHWIVYAAGTVEPEEARAYGVLFELLRQQTTLLILAPRDPERYEPVYREAIKYNLPTIRHSRLMTSYVPNKTRVYYVESREALVPLYQCADVVIAGGTLETEAGTRPDLITPLQLARPVIVGPVRTDRLTRSAIEAGVVQDCTDVETLAEAARDLLERPPTRQGLIESASEWLKLQVGAPDRVVELIVA